MAVTCALSTHTWPGVKQRAISLISDNLSRLLARPCTRQRVRQMLFRTWQQHAAERPVRTHSQSSHTSPSLTLAAVPSQVRCGEPV